MQIIQLIYAAVNCYNMNYFKWLNKYIDIKLPITPGLFKYSITLNTLSKHMRASCFTLVHFNIQNYIICV